MLRSQKDQLISELHEKFTHAKAIVFAEFSSLNVNTINRLRKKLRESKVEWKVLKNTLASRAAKGTHLETLSKDFVGPLAMAISCDDVIAPAKILADFAQDFQSIKIRSGILEGQPINAESVLALAKLPGLSGLRAQVLEMINRPATHVLQTIKEPSGALVRVLQAKIEKQ